MKADVFLREKEKYFENNIFFLYGEEYYLRCAAKKALLEGLDMEPRELNYTVLPPKTGVEELIAISEQLPFLGEHRVVLWEKSELLQKGDPGKLTEYLPHINGTTKLIITASGTPDKRRAFYKLLAKTACVIEADPLKPAELAKWVVAHGKAMGLSVTAAAANALIEISGRDMGVLENVLQKLKYAGRERPERADIEEIASKSGEYNAFLFHEHMLKHRYQEAFRILAEIRANEKTFVPLVALLASKFSPMYMAKTCLNAGMGPDKAAEELRARLKMHPFAAKKAVEECAYFKIGQLKNAIRQLGAYDLALKTGGANPGVEALVARLYGA